MTNVYKSWIPNVSGCLSFSNIRGSKVPGRAKPPKTHNRLSDEANAYIYSLQERNLSDTIYAPIDRGGMFYYLLSAKVEIAGGGEMLKGCIYAYPKLSLNTHEVELINSFGKADTKKIAEDIIDQRAQNSATTVVDFSLYRDGITELSYQGINPECAYDFVLEAYSFLKDLVHSHKFHQHDDDAIIVPYPVINDTDTKWIEKTIRNLHKSIVSIYRNTNYQADLINAIGRLSYLESFQEILQQRGIAKKLHTHIYTPTLKDSLETRLNSLEFAENGKTIINQVYIPILLSLIALLITMAQLLQIPCIEGLTYQDSCKSGSSMTIFKLPASAIETARYLLAYWFELAVLLPTFVVLLFLFANTKSFLKWLNQYVGYGFIWWIQRLTLGIAISEKFGRLVATAWILILVATLVYLASHVSGYLFSIRL